MRWFRKTARQSSLASSLADERSCATLEAPPAPGVLQDSSFHEELERALDGLKGSAVELERLFGETVTVLFSLSDRGRALVSGCERLVDLASGRASGMKALSDGMRLVESPLRFLGEHREQLDSERIIDRLVEDRELISTSLRAEGEIERTIAPLRTVRTLFKVVAAPLGDAVQAIFESLVEELSELHDLSKATVSARFAELGGAWGLLDGTIARMREQEAYWSQLASQRDQMRQSLGGLESQLSANAERETEIGGTSKRIASAIDQVVTGIQWQDIINQKLDHSTQAVRDMLRRMRDGSAVPASIHREAKVEFAQLRATRAELERAEAAVRAGLQGVLDELKHSDSSVVLLREFDTLTTSSTGVVQLLLDSIDSVESQLGLAMRSAEETLDTIKRIGETATSLTTAVRELSERTLLIGLNAQVQACKVAHGAGLGVLSARTADVSWQVARIGDAVAKKLERIASDLAACHRIFTDLAERGAQNQGSFRERRAEVEMSLHALRDEAFTLVQTTGAVLDEIDRSTLSALERIDYVSVTSDAFASLDRLLERMIEATASVDASADEDDAALQRAFESYTMESEREVFKAVAAGGAAAAASSTLAGEEVELFDAPAPEQPSSDAGVELFGDDALPSTTTENTQSSSDVGSSADADAAIDRQRTANANNPTKPSSDADSLGGNVELF